MNRDLSGFDPVAFGARIKEQRKALNMTQKQIAELLNISKGHYSLVERGLRGTTIENLYKFSKLFNVSVDYLVSGSRENFTDDERKQFYIENTVAQMSVYNSDEAELISIFAREFAKYIVTRKG